MSARFALVLGALLMFVAVALGAFGAHALKARLSPDLQAVWQTAVSYHAWHALGLVGVGLLLIHGPDRPGAALAGWLLLFGIVLFSGSLYAMALTGIKALGAVTPLGGAAFLAGWLALAWSAWKG
jgi:uncharacterized membrane protein YgdD (TMEM256/DUF423 family)